MWTISGILDDGSVSVIDRDAEEPTPIRIFPKNRPKKGRGHECECAWRDAKAAQICDFLNKQGDDSHGKRGFVAELRLLLDPLANGTHLDDVPNHSDDSLLEIAGRSSCSWAERVLRAHDARVKSAIKLLENEK